MAKKQSSKTYRELTKELDDILTKFDGNDLEIDQAFDLYKQASELIDQLETYLKSAKNSVTKLRAN